jgi:Holliday junction DNA helicase RuvA
MFDSITGALVRKDPGGVVIAAQGIGYRLNIPTRTLNALPEEGETTLYCFVIIKDDTLQLFGFQTPYERDLFTKIKTVGGIGAATALNLLSEIPPNRFLEAVAKENLALLQSVKGVGLRTAKRLVLELKDKIPWPDLPLEGTELAEPGEGPTATKTSRDLLAALQALGYPRTQAAEAASKALAACPETDKLELLIKTALRSL